MAAKITSASEWLDRRPKEKERHASPPFEARPLRRLLHLGSGSRTHSMRKPAFEARK